jgi:AcrR family transcriptional regulator
MASHSGSRLSLSRERILRAALTLADEDGIEALTMRRLGRELGFEAMSLYNHVRSKDDLLDGALDQVLDECEQPAPDGPWVVAVRRSAISVNRALRRHPWACTLLMRSAGMRPARLGYMDSLLGRLRGAGFPAESAYDAYHVLDGHIFGFSLWQISHSYTPEEYSGMAAVLAQVITPQDYPHLHEHGTQHMSGEAQHEADSFEVGLDLILDGLARMIRESGPTAASTSSSRQTHEPPPSR